MAEPGIAGDQGVARVCVSRPGPIDSIPGQGVQSERLLTSTETRSRFGRPEGKRPFDRRLRVGRQTGNVGGNSEDAGA